jgi:hypothetical protein
MHREPTVGGSALSQRLDGLDSHTVRQFCGCRKAANPPWEQETAGSNPAARTNGPCVAGTTPTVLTLGSGVRFPAWAPSSLQILLSPIREDMHTGTRGDIAEAMMTAALFGVGEVVRKPMGAHLRADLAIESDGSFSRAMQDRKTPSWRHALQGQTAVYVALGEAILDKQTVSVSIARTMGAVI